MTSLPTGIVALLFTDVEDSTRLVQELGDAYSSVMAEHRRVIRDAVTSVGGREIDCRGDEFFVAFASTRDAVHAAIAAQRTLAAQTWPSATPAARADGDPHRRADPGRGRVRRARRPPGRSDLRGRSRRAGARLAGRPRAARTRERRRLRLPRPRRARAEGPAAPRAHLPARRRRARRTTFRRCGPATAPRRRPRETKARPARGSGSCSPRTPCCCARGSRVSSRTQASRSSGRRRPPTTSC